MIIFPAYFSGLLAIEICLACFQTFVGSILFIFYFPCVDVFYFLFLAEPYNFSGRRGRKEPEVVAAASLKSLFIENQPYLVRGFSQHETSSKILPLNGVVDSQYTSNLERLRQQQVDSSDNIRSMAEKYRYMRETFRRRLAFGKQIS